MLKIAVANSRMAKTWTNREVTWEVFIKRLSHTHQTAETLEDFLALTRSEQDSIKDVGGFVLGHLRDGCRKAGSVVCRSAITLDMDYGTPGIMSHVKDRLPYKGCAYGTHKFSRDNPRLRLIFPLSRNITEEEYEPVARAIASKVGMDYFDDSTYEANRLMYWPSTPSDIQYYFESWDGPLVDPDVLLAQYADWRDISAWPTSSRQPRQIRQNAARQADPLTKDGIVGAFCRTYSVTEAINEFLPSIYEESQVSGRYTYIPGEGTAGVVIYEDKFAYSHHATDPAHGKLLNAFDLVRTHLYPNDDATASFRDMTDFALSQPELKKTLLEERRVQAQMEFEVLFDEPGVCNNSAAKDRIAATDDSAATDNTAATDDSSAADDSAVADDSAAANDSDDAWKSQLTFTRRGVLENTTPNLLLILRNDPDYKGFAFNEMAGLVEITGPVPWARPEGNRFWLDSDTCGLKAQLDTNYIAFSNRNHEVAFTVVSMERKIHPVRDYLNQLPTWDGIERIPTLLIDCMQADDTNYVRAVTRKTLTAAVARIYRPGIKFDSMLVLDGEQGIGKSTLFKELAGEEFFSDSLQLSDMDTKAAAEKILGIWVCEVAELAGMKKADIEKVKSFLSSSSDKYRPAYGHFVETHPRHGILVASVNGDRGYLRDITGNRRFWVVKLRQTEKVKKYGFTPVERDQIWAEAKHYYESGERLYLEDELIEQAEEVQKEALEDDDRQGMVEEYLAKLLPADWAEMDLYDRRAHLNHWNGIIKRKGTVKREYVSNIEIWSECFGNIPSKMKPRDSYAITALMTKVKGWKRTKQKKYLPLYGQQRVYVRE